MMSQGILLVGWLLTEKTLGFGLILSERAVGVEVLSAPKEGTTKRTRICTPREGKVAGGLRVEWGNRAKIAAKRRSQTPASCRRLRGRRSLGIHRRRSGPTEGLGR